MTYIKVTVFPESKKEEINLIGDNRFEIKVKEKAENNQANKKIIEILKSHFKNPEGGVKIINGHHSRIKLLKIGKE